MSLKNVTSLEVEIFSKCNRKCSWCPNSVVDRFSQNNYMSEETYLSFLHDMKKEIHDEENFKISWSRYNEPFLDIETLKKRVKQARDIFPNVILECNTNGDVLRKIGKEAFDGLFLDIVMIMDYDCRGVKHGEELFKKCGVKKLTDTDRKDVGIPLGYKKEHILLGTSKNIKLVKYVANWPETQDIQYRGGVLFDYDKNKNKELVSNYGNKGNKLNWIKGPKNFTNRGMMNTVNLDPRRKQPCTDPTTGIFVDHNGSVTPCCNIRSDVEMHKDFILGNINEDSIDNIYNSKKATKFRETLKKGDWKNYELPCKHCMSPLAKPFAGLSKVKLIQNLRKKDLEE